MDRRGFISLICAAIAAFLGGFGISGGSSKRRDRVVQKLVRDETRVGHWVTVKMKDIKKTDIFRMFEPDGEPFTDYDNNKIWVAIADAHRVPKEYLVGPDVWGVRAEPPNFPVIINPGPDCLAGVFGVQSMTKGVNSVFDWRYKNNG